jgi:hypothetical protein
MVSALLDQPGDAVAAMPPALLARDDEPIELADEVGGSDGAVAGHVLPMVFLLCGPVTPMAVQNTGILASRPGRIATIG